MPPRHNRRTPQHRHQSSTSFPDHHSPLSFFRCFSAAKRDLPVLFFLMISGHATSDAHSRAQAADAICCLMSRPLSLPPAIPRGGIPPMMLRRVTMMFSRHAARSVLLLFQNDVAAALMLFALLTRSIDARERFKMSARRSVALTFGATHAPLPPASRRYEESLAARQKETKQPTTAESRHDNNAAKCAARR